MGGGVGGWVNPLKTKVYDENLFSDNVERSSKDLWKASADVRADTSYNFLIFYKKYLQNLKHNSKSFG